MLFAAGFLIVTVCVGVGYVWHGGVLAVLWQPAEFLVILGAAFGAFLISNSMHTVMATAKTMPAAITGQSTNSKLYLDLPGLLFDIFNKARREGMMSIEADIEAPAERGVFTRYPALLKNARIIEFLTDNIRIMTTSNLAPHEIESMIDTEIETQMHEMLEPSHAISRIANGLPAFGIVAAVLVGTFVGIFIAYSFVGPMANRLAELHMPKSKCLSASRRLL